MLLSNRIVKPTYSAVTSFAEMFFDNNFPVPLSIAETNLSKFSFGTRIFNAKLFLFLCELNCSFS